jgi:hypothetical protein
MLDQQDQRHSASLSTQEENLPTHLNDEKFAFKTERALVIQELAQYVSPSPQTFIRASSIHHNSFRMN